MREQSFWNRCVMWLLMAGLYASSPSHACTLWSATGTNVFSGGTIISKNRDWKADHIQVLELHRNGTNFAYFGLYAVYATSNKFEGLKQGVNEKGLSAATATASSIPQNLRDAQKGRSGIVASLLLHYANCDQILMDKDKLFSNRKPMFVMISDRKKVLFVEIGLDGRYVVKTVESGTGVHSNHYLENSLSDCNIKAGESSTNRVARIAELLKTAPKPLNIPTFTTMSRDHHDGDNDSLWRTGSGIKTLSSWILENPQSGSPKLQVVIANPGQPEQTNLFVLNQKFWNDTRFEHQVIKEKERLKSEARQKSI